MAESADNAPAQRFDSLRDQVRSAVIWRSGTQFAGQLVTWAATFLVIRILSPQDYGLFAMTQVVLALLNMLNGYGFASAVIQRPHVDERLKRQLFGLLLILNLGLGALQVAMAPLAAAYFRQPIVADLLRVQALLYVATPFIAFPYALLARDMDFKGQAQANLASATLGALVSLAGALAGWGVWTLIAAPMALFWSRAIIMTWLARSLMWPSFDFRGAGDVVRFGGLMATSQLFWFLQSQADVFVAGRHLDPHTLGLYTTALFLTQVFVAKFLPTLNDVAFSAYARIQDDAAAMGAAFAKSSRIVMVAAMPFYAGLAVTAGPLVQVVLGEKWLEAAPLVAVLAVAMPFMTLQTLFAPATNARGLPAIAARLGAVGGVLLPIAFVIGVQFGVTGLALAWVAVWPLYLAITAARSLREVGLGARALAAAIAPPVLAGLGMAVVVALIDAALPPLSPLSRLAILVAAGALTYGGWLALFARETLAELVAFVRRRG
ncbi:lipopolysaccharide biosynthesis protein [Sphingomonas spermidinifaciens]|uniref:Lipopolysaccharide biosynthesis protein n=1 Tax=Sphingomonas spermidinifaciens TaxID=1141889 RepID=A0A2A4B9E3_9SPHN|nr:lipopolysaccharide biosynthesis protein [Sphingomonas spermidinifaciens]PCD04572.1 lipopolysaccharide biosynthesis protein [Sphingomonas spermidinifaciens]